jgi:hypothetical protein
MIENGMQVRPINMFKVPTGKGIECHCSMVFSFMTMTHHGINVQPKRKKQPLTLDRDPVS